jgi:hypothetical protein
MITELVIAYKKYTEFDKFLTVEAGLTASASKKEKEYNEKPRIVSADVARS